MASIHKSMESHSSNTFLISLDIQKAFDTVNHDKLINVLQALNLPDSLTIFLQNYLKTDSNVSIIKIKPAITFLYYQVCHKVRYSDQYFFACT